MTSSIDPIPNDFVGALTSEDHLTFTDLVNGRGMLDKVLAAGGFVILCNRTLWLAQLSLTSSNHSRRPRVWSKQNLLKTLIIACPLNFGQVY